jgi:hypothetical protein
VSKFRTDVVAGTAVVGVAPRNTEVIEKIVLISIDPKSEVRATMCIKEVCIFPCSLLGEAGDLMLEENRFGELSCTN